MSEASEKEKFRTRCLRRLKWVLGKFFKPKMTSSASLSAKRKPSRFAFSLNVRNLRFLKILKSSTSGPHQTYLANNPRGESRMRLYPRSMDLEDVVYRMQYSTQCRSTRRVITLKGHQGRK
ncbi:hypothetical protein AVEN_16822-1 [Araneus ventricosus]|uniref:Uncharacterized protein n=1 Tax=Araneus ventricosus TaxID=182803 RepID=A0A4Y2BS97_ARAVE|nr:hypothetical protein AVEN_16822-1 [Araneus ventricosus]